MPNHQWLKVSAKKGEREGDSLQVCVNKLHYDEDGDLYLLAFEGAYEKRLYLELNSVAAALSERSATTAPTLPRTSAGYMLENFDDSDPEQIDKILDAVHQENIYYDHQALDKKNSK